MGSRGSNGQMNVTKVLGCSLFFDADNDFVVSPFAVSKKAGFRQLPSRPVRVKLENCAPVACLADVGQQPTA
jgi:hypothetical protein